MALVTAASTLVESCEKGEARGERREASFCA